MNKTELQKKMEGKSKHVGCLCCPSTADILPMNTKLYTGFGGWTVTQDGATVIIENDDPDECGWENLTELKEIEKLAIKNPESTWIASLYLPLRGATYQRSDCGQWILIDINEGFA